MNTPAGATDLATHVRSSAGDASRTDISTTFLQPFMAYRMPGRTTYTVQTESTYECEAEQWSVPIHPMVTQLFRAGEQNRSLNVGAHHWAEGPDAGPEGWRLRVTDVLVFPK